MIVMPGLIDGHRHCWQNQFRRVIPDADLHEYVKTLHGDFAVNIARTICTWAII